jgi:hypothetical protein
VVGPLYHRGTQLGIINDNVDDRMNVMSLCHIVPMRGMVRVDGLPDTIAVSLHRGVRSPHTVACPLHVTSRSMLYCHRLAASMS